MTASGFGIFKRIDGKTWALVWGAGFTDKGTVLNLTYAALISSYVLGTIASLGFAWYLRESVR